MVTQSKTHAQQTRTSLIEQCPAPLRWFAACLFLSLLVGSSVALFLWLLEFVTQLHWSHGPLLFILPLAGAASGLMYHCLDATSRDGNVWVYNRIRELALTNEHESGSQANAENAFTKTAWIMAPLVMVGTLLTHLGGGSAGREGTAVQMGGSLAGGLANWLRLSRSGTALLFQIGVASGFSAVFGTPLAATLFAIEVVGSGTTRVIAVLPCLCTAILADRVVNWWGLGHTSYTVNIRWLESIELVLVLKLVALGIAFGSAAWLFLQSVYLVRFVSQKLIPTTWMRPFVGGVVIVGIVLLTDSRQYLGLGVEANPNFPQSVSIVSTFSGGGVEPLSWLWKSLLTAITVGTGFKGGEATPLFFVGSTLGNALASGLHLPIDIAAGLGFVAVFSSATRTPLACTLMAVELFSGQSDPYPKILWAFCALLTCQVASRLRFNVATELSRS